MDTFLSKNIVNAKSIYVLPTLALYIYATLMQQKVFLQWSQKIDSKCQIQF